MSDRTFRDPQLRALDKELADVRVDSPLKGASLRSWIAKARIYIGATYPSHVSGFDDATREPLWIDAPMFTAAERAFAGITATMRQEMEISRAYEKNLSLAYQWIGKLRGALQGIDQYAAPASLARPKQQKFGILDAPNLLAQDLASPPGRLGRVLVYFDVDNFKAVNSKYTERIVDRDLLPALHQLVAEATGDIGYAYAEGGDEMVVLLPNATIGMGIACADAIRRLIVDSEFLVNQEHVKLTASFGVAVDRLDAPDGELAEKANQAKNQAKADGKNCVCVATDESFYVWSDPVAGSRRDSRSSAVATTSDESTTDVRTFSNASSLYEYVIERIATAKDSVDDVTWGAETKGIDRIGQDRNLYQKYLETIRRIGRGDGGAAVCYQEVIDVSGEHRSRAQDILAAELDNHHLKRPGDRTKNLPLLSFMIVDRSEVIFAFYRTPSQVVKKGEDIAMAIRHPVIVAAFQAYFNKIWERSVQVTKEDVGLQP